MEENLSKLVAALIQEPTETEWLEFKKDNADIKMIGKDISALANGARLVERDHAYMIWGVDDQTHKIVGTSFSPYEKAVGQQELIGWLNQMLSDNARFRFEEVGFSDKRVIVLTIEPTSLYPVAFQKEPYIRLGSATKRLAEETKLQVQLWDRLRDEKFELTAALSNLTADDVKDKLNVDAYFHRLQKNAPDLLSEKLKHLEADQIIKRQDNQLFSITNYGALLLANDLQDFPSVSTKEIRVVQYQGNSRRKISRSKDFHQGYAVCVSDLFNYIDALLPSSEPITRTGEREILRPYPMDVMRELLINALIHQDLTFSGSCVKFEIFDHQVEISNPGALLIEKNRIVDLPPRSRNVLLAKMMRRMHFCEELGTGWDRVVEECEIAQLPSPEIRETENSTQVIIRSHVDFFELVTEQKLWSCYLHACIQWLKGKSTTNATLRDRFGLDRKSSSSISRLLAQAVSVGLLKCKEESVGTKAKKYVPYWA